MRIIDCQQGSAEWFAARMGVPTASNFDRLITKSGKPSTSADDYIAELIDEAVRPLDLREVEEQEAQFRGNRHTDRGHALEPKARNYYRFLTGSIVTECGFVLADDGLAGCSPDSLVDPETLWSGGLEIKAPEGKKHVRWMMDGILPDEHKAQVHGSLIVTGADFWDFLSYCPGYKPFLIRTVPDSYTALLAAELRKFTDKLAATKTQFVEYLPQHKEAA